MLIPCPFCGPRDSSEFTYRGDANGKRPDPSAPDAVEQFHDYVYMRDNPAGPHAEWWYHGGGCRSWVKVVRNTETHEIVSATLAEGDAE